MISFFSVCIVICRDRWMRCRYRALLAARSLMPTHSGNVCWWYCCFYIWYKSSLWVTCLLCKVLIFISACRLHVSPGFNENYWVCRVGGKFLHKHCQPFIASNTHIMSVQKVWIHNSTASEPWNQRCSLFHWEKPFCAHLFVNGYPHMLSLPTGQQRITRL